MKSTLDVLDELESVSGRLKKEAILAREKDNEVLKKILHAVEDPYLVFYINKFSRQNPVQEERTPQHLNSNMVGFLQFMYSLSRRELTGNAARGALERFLASSTAQEQKWMERIVKKNLRIGVQESTISKVWPGLVPTFCVQLAETLKVETTKDRTRITKVLTPLTYPFRFEPKFDGFRLVAMKERGVVTLRTRNGNEVGNFPELKKALEAAQYDDVVLDGEIFGVDFQVSASIILSDVNRKDETVCNYHAFDAIPLSDWKKQECELVYTQRQDLLLSILEKIDSPRVQPVIGCTINSEEELLETYQEYIERGEEGGMIKPHDSLYAFDRSWDLIKMKPETTHEGIVVGWYEGKTNTKREGVFGGFEVMLPNKVVTRVGSGFKDALLEEVWNSGPETYKKRIVEVAGQLLTGDGKIRFPRFKRFRDPSDVDPAVVALIEDNQG